MFAYAWPIRFLAVGPLQADIKKIINKVRDHFLELVTIAVRKTSASLD